MPAPKTANGLQLEMRFTLAGEPAENVYHLLVNDATPPGELMTTAASVFQTWWATEMVGHFSTTLILREIYVVDLTAEDGATLTYTPESPIPGIHPSPQLPNNVAVVATKRTSQRGRSYRGRTYFGGIPEGEVTNSTLSPSLTFDINTNCALLLTMLTAANMTLGVLSKRINGAWRPTGVITPVNTYALRDSRTDSQRGRLPE